MTFPTVQARNTTALASGTGARTHNLPAGITAGDLLYLFVVVAVGVAGISTPAGWTVIPGANDSIGNTTGEHFYKIASGSEGSTVSVTQSGTGGTSSVALRISGSGGGIVKGTASNNVSTTPDPPSLGPVSWGLGDTLWIEIVGSNAAQASATASTNYGNLQRASNVGAAITAERNLAALTENPGTLTLATSINMFSNTIAIQGGTPFYPWRRIRNYIRKGLRY